MLAAPSLACSHDDNTAEGTTDEPEETDAAENYALTLVRNGRDVFRYDTFGSEAFWGDTLHLNQAIGGQTHGGVGPGLSPVMALQVGLKIDVDALSPGVLTTLQSGADLDDPASTIALLQADAVLGVRVFSDAAGAVTAVGITCALCHSTVDDSLAPGIGHRRDGWPNRDLDIGTIISLAPDLSAVTSRLGTDRPTLEEVLRSWGPGKFDAVLLQDRKAYAPDFTPGATLIPPAFGLAGVNLSTWTGFGSVPYWNAYVATTQMRGQGTFYDPRLNNPFKYPLAYANGDWNLHPAEDKVTSTLPALHVYQLALSAPAAPDGSFDAAAAARGKTLFAGKADCARCHVPPLYLEPGWSMHTGAEIGIDDYQAARSPDERYRTAPLRGLWTHTKGGFYHDGRFATLAEVIEHYDATFGLGLAADEMADLEQYLLSL